MATHSSIPAWKIPWSEETDRLQSMWGRKELDMTKRLHFVRVYLEKNCDSNVKVANEKEMKVM